MTTVRRKVSFFRVLHDEGEIDWREVIEGIDGNVQLIGGGAQRLTATKRSTTLGPPALELGLTRLRDLPLREGGGETSGLDLGDEEGVYDASFAVFFDDDVVGIVGGQRGPRAGRFEQLLLDQFEGELELASLIDRTAVQRIEAMQEMAQLRVKLRPSMAGAAAGNNLMLTEASKLNDEYGEWAEVELSLKINGRERHEKGLRTSKIRSLVKSLTKGENAERVKRIDVVGWDAEDERNEIEVLAHKLRWEEPFEAREDERTRSILPASAIEGIMRVYGQHRARIDAAVEVLVMD